MLLLLLLVLFLFLFLFLLLFFFLFLLFFFFFLLFLLLFFFFFFFFLVVVVVVHAEHLETLGVMELDHPFFLLNCWLSPRPAFTAQAEKSPQNTGIEQICILIDGVTLGLGHPWHYEIQPGCCCFTRKDA